ncbi:hypothetical protein L1F06_008925 [Ectopseudomonas hydrolytica]|uniref:Sulfotransferase family protein n=1 Tax=Ectopseudomonas hydrolytica TaxID=2493633 RepID=A0ABY5ACG4_9GAMM|nr:hypothetical protein [Pseudomonas hydrolytica]USR41530.1 hypothetical protein L1F06_008925 [Pseudomonas hydrolytica]
MTIISFEHRFVFVKTRKTASTSLEAFLRRYTVAGDVVTQLTPRDEKWCVERGWCSCNYAADPEVERAYMQLCMDDCFDEAMRYIRSAKRLYVGHMPASKIKRLLEGNGYRWEDFHFFTVERHPYSWLLFVLLYNNSAYHERGACEIDLNDINERARAFIESEGFLQRLNSNLYTEEGRLLVKDVMRYENLQEDLARMLTPLVGTPDMSEFPFLKKNAQHLSPTDVFDVKTLELLRRKAEPVLQLAGYER